jgi:hypothetical protein
MVQVGQNINTSRSKQVLITAYQQSKPPVYPKLRLLMQLANHNWKKSTAAEKNF